jgi:hypothetical protein
MNKKLLKDKKWKTKVNGEIVKQERKEARIGKVGSAKQKSYCARSFGIAKKFQCKEKKTPKFTKVVKMECPLDELEK